MHIGRLDVNSLWWCASATTHNGARRILEKRESSGFCMPPCGILDSGYDRVGVHKLRRSCIESPPSAGLSQEPSAWALVQTPVDQITSTASMSIENISPRMRRSARRLPTARPPCNQASSVLGSPQSPAHMARDDPDRASTNEAKWMWTIYTPCLLLFRHPGGIPRHYLFVSPSPVLRPSSLSSSVVSCLLAPSDNLQPQQSHSSEGDCLGQKLFCLCFSFFFGLNGLIAPDNLSAKPL